MALNFPGPYEIRLFYTVTVNGQALEHELRNSVDVQSSPLPGDAFATITGLTPDGSVQDLAQYTDGIWGVMAPLMDQVAVTFGRTELWKYTPLTFDAAFISVYQTTVVPTNTADVVPASYQIYTFRTVEGGIMRITLLEGQSASNAQLSYPTGSPPTDALFDWFINPAASLALARDTSRPFAALRASYGQNETVWRKRYRS